MLEGSLCYCAVFLCFVLFCICVQFPNNLSPWGLIIYSEGQFNGGFLCYEFAGLMFGRTLILVAAYFWQASQHVYMRCWCHSCHLQKLQHTVMQNNSTFTTPVANTSKELLCLFIFQVISSLFGTVGFFLVEWKARRNAQQGYAPISWDFVGLSPSVAITIVLSAIELKLFLGLLSSARALSNNLIVLI